MANRADDHLEFEKICWMATMERDPNGLVELSLRMCELMNRRMGHDADSDAAGFEEAMFSVSSECRWNAEGHMTGGQND
jgi:hypothetical protein